MKTDEVGQDQMRWVTTASHDHADRTILDMCARLQVQAEAVPILIVTPVAGWVDSARPEEVDRLLKETPIRPPYDSHLIVWADHNPTHPGTANMATLHAATVDAVDLSAHGKHLMAIRVGMLNIKNGIEGASGDYRSGALLVLDEHDRLRSMSKVRASRFDSLKEIQLTARYEIEIICTALAMCNVRNIGLHEQRIPRAIRRPLEREHGKLPELFYHTLHLRNTPGEGGRVSDAESCVPLHLVRGHFVHYTEAAKMFGKYAGTFWCPAHERGDAKFGEVRKSYIVDGQNEG